MILTMNLISETHHLYERRDNAFICSLELLNNHSSMRGMIMHLFVVRDYLIIFLHLESREYPTPKIDYKLFNPGN